MQAVAKVRVLTQSVAQQQVVWSTAGGDRPTATFLPRRPHVHTHRKDLVVVQVATPEREERAASPSVDLDEEEEVRWRCVVLHAFSPPPANARASTNAMLLAPA